MAIQITNLKTGYDSNGRTARGTITLDTLYVAGGYAVPVSQLGFRTQIDGMVVNIPGILAIWDAANQLLIIYHGTGLVVDTIPLDEANAGTDLHTYGGAFFAWGE